MATDWSLSEFAALVGRSEEDVEHWRAAGLLDPTGSGVFDELDLVRLLEIREGEADGYGPQELARAIRSGEVKPFLSDYLYPRGPDLSIEQAAARAEIDPADLRALRTALGFTSDTLFEHDVQGAREVQTDGRCGFAVGSGA